MQTSFPIPELQPLYNVWSPLFHEFVAADRRGMIESMRARGDRIWVTRMEHHANLLPWQRVSRKRGAELRVIELSEDGSLDWQAAEELFDRRTRLIALGQISNVLGIENPVQALCERAAAEAIPVLVDAAQSVAHSRVDVTDLDCDFLAFSAHKMYGPTGIGALYAKAERFEEMEPLLVGGGMVDEVTLEAASWADCPQRFEAGSPNLAGAAVDSAIFPALAFGPPWLWPVMLGQFAAKVAGGKA